MKPLADIEAITFDLDGTLYDDRAIRWRYVLQNWTSLRVVRVTRRVREELRTETFVDGGALEAEVTRRVAERLEASPEEARKQIQRALHERLVNVLEKVGPRADALSVLETLADRGLRIGVVSDYAVDEKLTALGLAHLPWAVRVAADSLGALKPHERCFVRAADALALPTNRVLHVGDRFDTDVLGAQKAGMYALLLGAFPSEKHPDVTCVPSLTGVLQEIFPSPP